MKYVQKGIDVAALYSPFLEILEELEYRLDKRGLPFYVIRAFSTYAEQDALYAQGRTVLYDAKGNKLPVVTKAKGGQSFHNFWVAADFCKDADATKAGLQPSWKDTEYRELATEAVNLKLEAGFFWKGFMDAPHIQLPIEEKGLTLKRLKELHDKGGQIAVFQELNKYKWGV